MVSSRGTWRGVGGRARRRGWSRAGTVRCDKGSELPVCHGGLDREAALKDDHLKVKECATRFRVRAFSFQG